MTKRVSALMTTPVTTVRADDTAAAVTEALQQRHLSFVPVTEGPQGHLLGIISASDILHFQAAGRDLKTVKAWQICAYKPLAVDADTTAVEVARLMVENQVHHVVVMKDLAVVGIVSSLDFVRQYIEQEAGEQEAGRG